MSVRMSLLTILGQGPSYGYRLRTEFERRTGGSWPLNVGQIYNTLERLDRDGLVARGGADEHGHVFYAITAAGSAAVRSWLGSLADESQRPRDELAMKIAIAATMPGTEVSEVIRSQRAASAMHLDGLRSRRSETSGDAGPGPESPEDLARSLVVEAAFLRAEAEVRWLDYVVGRLAQHPRHEIEIEVTRPRRGRPPRTAVG